MVFAATLKTKIPNDLYLNIHCVRVQIALHARPMQHHKLLFTILRLLVSKKHYISGGTFFFMASKNCSSVTKSVLLGKHLIIQKLSQLHV